MRKTSKKGPGQKRGLKQHNTARNLMKTCNVEGS